MVSSSARNIHLICVIFLTFFTTSFKIATVLVQWPFLLFGTPVFIAGRDGSREHNVIKTQVHRHQPLGVQLGIGLLYGMLRHPVQHLTSDG